MKLYYSPSACSLAPHIVSLEAGIDLKLEKVDGKTKKTASGADFWAVNPKGYVPALELDNGEVLTEGPAIVQYLADQKPEAGLAPAAGTLGRYRLVEALGYINSEIHKTYSPLFSPGISDALREDRLAYLKKRYAYLDTELGKHQYLVGDKFTVADAYLFTVTNWAEFVKLDLSQFKNVLAFQKRIGGRPAVQAALKAEGLVK